MFDILSLHQGCQFGIAGAKFEEFGTFKNDLALNFSGWHFGTFLAPFKTCKKYSILKVILSYLIFFSEKISH